MARPFVKGSRYDIMITSGERKGMILKPEDTLALVDAALAAPPRNCDRFVSSEESLLAYSATYLDDDDARPHYATLAHFLFAEAKGDAK